MKWFRRFRTKKNKQSARSRGSHFRKLRGVERLEDRQMLSAVPLVWAQTSIEAEIDDGLPGDFSPSPATSPPMTTDLGDHYFYFDEQVDMLRVLDQFVVSIEPAAIIDNVVAELTGAGGSLQSYTYSNQLNDREIVFTRPQSIAFTEIDLNQVEGAIGVAWAAPLFVGKEHGSRGIVTDEISIALAPGIDPETFFASGFESWERFVGNQYIAMLADGGLFALDTANQLAIDEDVVWAQPNFYVELDLHTNDPLFDDQWPLDNTSQFAAKSDADADVEEAWDTSTGNSNIAIAVLDSGVSLNHPDLHITINQDEIPPALKSQLSDVDEDGIISFIDLNQPANAAFVFDHNGNGRIDATDLLRAIDVNNWQNGGWEDGVDGDVSEGEEETRNGFIDDLFGWDFTSADIGDNDPSPGITNASAHGTAVAGIAAAIGNNMTGITGVSQNSTILPVRISSAAGFVSYPTLARAVYYAAGAVLDASGQITGTWDAADVINASWGGGVEDAGLATAFNWAATSAKDGQGIPVFVASGNSAAGRDGSDTEQYIGIGLNTSLFSAFGNSTWSWVLSYEKNISGSAGENTVRLGRFVNDGTNTRWDSPTIVPSGWDMAPIIGFDGWYIEDNPARAHGTGRYQARSNTITLGEAAFIMAPPINVTSSNPIMSAAFYTWQSSAVADTMNLYLFNHADGELYTIRDNEDNNVGEFAGVVPILNQTLDVNVAFPANLSRTIPGVVAVGASTDWDYRSHYSQYGTALDLVAPSNGGYAGVTTTGKPGSAGASPGDYSSTFGGTSAAAPLAAGIAALILSKNPSLSAAQVREIMQNTADQIGGNNGVTTYIAGINQFYGHGRVNAAAALAATPLLGDYNGDGSVDAADYTVWRDTDGSAQGYEWWVAGFGGGTAMLPGDYNGDGVVNAADYTVWRDNFGSTTNLEADADGNGIVDQADYDIWRGMFNVTTMAVIVGDYNGDGIVNAADYVIWRDSLGSQTELDADGNGNGIIDQGDYDIWVENFGLTNAGVFPATLVGNGGPPLRIVDQAPHITEVTISGSGSTHDPYNFSGVTGSGEQLRTVPVGGANRLQISFSEEVLVTSSALTLTRMQGSTLPNVIAFTYDLNTHTATWQFDDELSWGQYLVQLSDSVFDLDHDALDGEFSNPWSVTDATGASSTLPSGDGEAGGEFRFRFTILAGDYNHNNATDAADYTVWSANSSVSSGATHGQGDGDGDGDVDSNDYDIWYSQFGINFVNWPSSEPGMILVSTATDESDGDYSFGDVSLREALLLAAANPGPDTIVFRQDLFDSSLTLSLGQLLVDSDVTIAGPGADRLAISGGNATRVLNVASGTTVLFSGITITEGKILGTNDGAGIYSQGDLTLDEVVVSDNEAGRYGGGLYMQSGSVSVINSTFDGNTAVHGGGGRFNMTSNGPVHIVGSTFSNNHASSSGGGIFIWGGGTTEDEFWIVNSTFSANTTAQWGGAIRVMYQDPLHIVNSTIYDNHAGSDGGGISSVAASIVTAQNTIIAQNTAPSYPDALVQWGFTGASANNLIGGDPLLGLLGYNGGLTKTHALLAESPAIDAGNNSLALAPSSNPLLFDQRGLEFTRFSGASVDIGAFEFVDSMMMMNNAFAQGNDGGCGGINSGSTKARASLDRNPSDAAVDSAFESLYDQHGRRPLALGDDFGDLIDDCIDKEPVV